jgi:alpha-beta hydrolase superfamily lysophospholipase
MTPVNQPIKAVVGHCHAYSDHASHTRRKELIYFVQRGIAVVMIESEGHGKSDGSLGLLPNWDIMTNDLHTYFQEVSASNFPSKKFFLNGEVRLAL